MKLSESCLSIVPQTTIVTHLTLHAYAAASNTWNKDERELGVWYYNRTRATQISKSSRDIQTPNQHMYQEQWNNFNIAFLLELYREWYWSLKH